jgi:hypothetical protein
MNTVWVAPVHHHDVRAGRHGQLDVVLHPGRAELDVHRLLPAGGLAQLLDLDAQVIRAGPVRVPGGGPLVDAGRQGTHPGHPLADLLAEQHAAAARLGALADDDLDGVGGAQVFEVETVAGRQALVDQQPGGLALLRGHPAVAGGGGGARGRGRPAQRLLGLRGQRAEAHPGDRDRDGQLQRAAGVPGAEHGRGAAPLPVALQRVPGQRGGQEGQVVEGGQGPLGAPAADLVAALVGHLVNLADDLGAEGVAGLRPGVHQYL